MKIAQAILDPQGSVLSGRRSLGRQAALTACDTTLRSKPEGRKMRTRLGEYFAVLTWAVRGTMTTLLLFCNRSPRRSGGARAQRGTSVDPAIPTFRRKCWAFDFAVVLDF
jgi:hypothetical protein